MQNLARLLVLTIMLLLGYGFFHFGLDQYLTLETLNQQRDELINFAQQQPVQAYVVFFLLYVFVTGLSLPGAATILTLAAGVIFGVVAGSLLVSISSTVGATVAFLVARFLLRDFVQTRFADRLRSVNDGVRKDGVFYLLSLRLIPVFPFFVINIVMGLTPLKTWKYFVVSMLGMFPATVVYVNAGSQLAHIESLAGIASPGLLISFALLGIFPWLAKACMAWLHRRRVYRAYKRPRRYDYNLIVIGAGAGGLVSAYIAAAVKAKVALIEKHKMGGDCLNTGCVPSKALIRTAKMMSYARRGHEFGLEQSTPELNFAAAMERVQQAIGKIEPHDSVERYTDLGVEVIEGEAMLQSPWKVSVNGRVISARNIIVATGARPFVPEIAGIKQISVLTSDNIWRLRELPARLLVVGGGPIGAEMAQTFQRLGSQVTLLQRGEYLLPREDFEVSEFIQQKFEAEGMRVLTSHQLVSFRQQEDTKLAIAKTEEGEAVEIEFDQVLVALGRKPNVEGFGLEALGVELEPNTAVKADPFLRTSVPNISVVGDVTGPYQFTHTASHQAWYAAVNALFGHLRKFQVDYRVIPWATYTDPEIARVGLNEQEAKQQGVAYEVARYDISDLDRAIVDGEAHGWVKVLTLPGKDTILGVSIVGHRAGDLIAEYVTAMKYGLGLNRILGSIHIYPTMSEANKFAAGVWKRQHAPARLLKILEKYHRWRR